MIGIDIVDITEASLKSNWRRKGFLEKVFTAKEQLCISNSYDPGLIVWLLWSMKESAYKIYSRQQRKFFVSPLKIGLESLTAFNEGYKGKVIIENFLFSTASKVTKEFISTTALPYNLLIQGEVCQKDIRFINKDFNKQREEIYKSISITFSKKKNKPADSILIKKDGLGIPYIYEGKRRLNTSISISHHGCYGTYALLLNKDN